ncbi:MAG: TonB-dependent receptor [Proteobacteria bacterium]|nr:TonB-dependent receptor [Pseudomonadota bacterium]
MNKTLTRVLAKGGAAAIAVLGIIALPAQAQTASKKDATGEPLQEVVVTGSLIPQTEKETSQPLTVITTDDIQKKGFASVAEALQHTSFATGSVQGPQFSVGFTPGAEVLSLFGLSPAYTKYLIDGKPIADYPALYNGTDTITSISGIPNVMLDRIDVLPGGQSSIYGSDAIAGVVNIILKKKMEGPEADLRYGWTKDGGGNQLRLGLADGFSAGNFNLLVGGQYETIDPIWGYQRPPTNAYFNGNPNSPAVGERDWLVIGNPYDFSNTNYQFLDPTGNCSNLAGQFGGTVGVQTRPGRSPAGDGGPGTFCGTKRAGFYTIDNGQENTQLYLHATYDFTPNVQVFGDVLYSHEVIRYSPGTSALLTASDGGPYYYFEDPSVPGQYLNLQRIFSPEEAGDLSKEMNKNTTNSTRATLGLQGGFGATNWKYIADFTFTENKLTEATHLAFTQKIWDFFSTIMGPQLGFGPGGQPLYSPDWSAYYTPITPADYASFTGYAFSYSNTQDSLGRIQLTNSSLFALPGGDAGIAVVAEGGRQGWRYDPDPAFLNGDAYLYTAVAGDGHRTRYAGTTEIRLPVLKQVTIDLSGRYDDYKLDDGSFNKFTYNIGLEYRPLRSLLVRGRYGTAFKAPTLSDEFQGNSGFFTSSSNDYYYCYTHGYNSSNIAGCAQAGISVAGSTQGNPGLKPINATVWDGGLVWSPLERSSFSIDYMHWHITNEVQTLSDDQLLRTEAACRLGQIDINSPTCVQALADVTRDPTTGFITSIFTPKENLAEENLSVLVFQGNYLWNIGSFGTMGAQLSYTHTLNHSIINFPGDPTIDLLTNPFYSTEFRDKGNASLTWNYDKFTTTLYGEYYGTSPNNQATLDNSLTTPNAGKLHPWWIANASVSYELLKGLTVTANVNNLFNKMPPMDPTYKGIDNQPYNFENYNPYGTSYFIGAYYKFK